MKPYRGNWQDWRRCRGFLEKLDLIGHWLRLPFWLIRPVCDKVDRRILGDD